MGQVFSAIETTAAAATVLPYAAKAYKFVVDSSQINHNIKSFNDGVKAVRDVIGILQKTIGVLKHMNENLSGKIEEIKSSLDHLKQVIEHIRNSGLQWTPQDVMKIGKIYADLNLAFAKLHERHQEINGRQTFQKRMELTIQKWTTIKQMKEDLQSIANKIKDAVQKSIELTIMLSSNAVAKLEILQLYNINRKWPVGNSTVIPPKAPQLTVDKKGCSFKLSWQREHYADNETVEYFELCYTYDDQCSFIALQGTTHETEIGPPEVCPGKICVMKIRGINLGGPGRWSNEVVDQVTKPPPCKPNPPIIHANVSDVVITVTTPTRSCESESPVREWNVEYSTGSSKERWSCKNYAVMNGKKQPLPVRNLSPKTRYYFRVQAINMDGKSDFSQPVVIETGSFKTTADNTMMLTIFGMILLLSLCCVICMYAIQ